MSSRVRGSTGSKLLVRAGLPLVTFLVGGSLVLSHFMQTHMEIKDKRNTSVSKRKFDLEEEHKVLTAKLNLDNFSLSRIPRPEGVDDAETLLKKKKERPEVRFGGGTRI